MLKEEVKKHLVGDLIPFWEGMRDQKYGGYYGYLDYDLKLMKEAEKGCILNSRILWFFSNAYLLLGNSELLEYATHAFQFMKTNCVDREFGGVYWAVEYDGSVKDSTKHTYNQAFAIYSLSSYYDATKNQEALDLAYELFHLIEEKCMDEIGYLEAFDRKFNPVDNDKLSENGVIAHKTMNTLLHILEGYTELYRVTKDQVVANRLKWILDMIESNVYNRELHRQEVFFDEHMNSILDLHSYGHDIETAWLVDRTCEILGEEEYTRRMSLITKDLTREIYKVAYKDHSLLNECEKGIVNTSRIWWVQAEALVGFLNGYEKDKKRTEYKEAVYDIWDYIKNYLIDKRTGSEWYWELDENRLPSSKKPIVEPWKCPYHNGRMCFEIIRRSDNVS